MKLILLVLFALSCRTINARLIEKITDRTLTTETKTTGSSPPVRLTRNAFEEDLGTGSSKEDHVGSQEQVRSVNKKVRLFNRSKARKDEPSSLIRVQRESNEKVGTSKKNTSTSHHAAKQKSTHVNRPIPKYETDYDDDFQMKVNRSPVRVVDSGEHEDEDFNLDDYDFDVNHDEFIGRGKPLEPRTKSKINQEHSNHRSPKQEIKFAPHPDEKPQRKTHAPAAPHRPISSKKERALPDPPKKAGEKDDYYDDATTTQKAPENEKEKARDLDDEFNDDNEESKESESTASSVRTIRSPWKMNHMDKSGEKDSYVMSKVLSILPMFPQVPDHQIVDPSTNPWQAKA